MRYINYIRPKLAITAGAVVMAVMFVVINAAAVSALTPIPTPDPQPGSYGVEATKRQPPPTQGATITVPGNGASFTTSPIVVNGICPSGLLVQVYNNNVMAGSVMCAGGSFSIEISLFAGTNELHAIVYDDLDQAGPSSNVTTVTYNDTQFAAFGQLLTLTSTYGRRSAATGSQLSWPLQLSGGTGPYAFQIDWGDGSEVQLISQSLAGLLNAEHIYKKAGIYQVNIRVADTNGVTAFLQVVAVSSGVVEPEEDAGSTVVETRNVVLWVPAVIVALLLTPTYWLGRRSQLVSLRTKMLKERDAYQEDNLTSNKNE